MKAQTVTIIINKLQGTLSVTTHMETKPGTWACPLPPNELPAASQMAFDADSSTGARREEKPVLSLGPVNFNCWNLLSLQAPTTAAAWRARPSPRPIQPRPLAHEAPPPASPTPCPSTVCDAVNHSDSPPAEGEERLALHSEPCVSLEFLSGCPHCQPEVMFSTDNSAGPENSSFMFQCCVLTVNGAPRSQGASGSAKLGELFLGSGLWMLRFILGGKGSEDKMPPPRCHPLFVRTATPILTPARA